MRRASTAPQGGGGKRLRLDDEDNKKLLGKIESISLQNFMCHDNFAFKFGPRMNFIIGQNGSGKSAILTALILALGGRSKATGRFSNVKGFIKTGKRKAKIEVILYNTGDFAYKPKDYGDRICVTREFSDEGVNTYKLKSQAGKIVSCKKDDLISVLNAMDIQIENPIQIFTQEISRNFLVSKHATGENLYDIFCKGTGLQKLEQHYLETKKLKNDALEELERKRQVLPAMRKELEALNKYLSSAKKVTAYKNELLWAGIIEMEKQLEKKQIEFQKVENLIQINKAEIEKCKTALELKEKKFDESSKKREEFATSKSEQITILKKINENRDTAKMELRKHETALALHKDEHRKIKNEIERLQQRISENRQKTQIDVQAEERRRQDLIDHLQTQNEEISQEIQEIQRQCQEKNEEGKDKQQKMDELNAEVNDFEYRCRKTEETINRTRMALQNKVNVFGPYTQNVLNEIAARAKRNEFRKIPIGPIGKYVEVKDPKWIPAIEKCVSRSLLCSYCVDNHDDNRLLRSILQKHCGNRLPTTIVCPYSENIHDVSQHRAHYSPTVLDMLNISNTQVANALIDHAKIENKILLEDTKSAQNLMLHSPPRNCNSAYIANCDQICLFPYRYYSEAHPPTNCLLSSLQQTDISQHQRMLQDLKAKLQAKLREKHGTQKEIEAIPVEIRKLFSQIKKCNAQLTENREKIKDAQIVEEQEDVDCLEEDLEQLKQDYTNVMDKIDKAKQNVTNHASVLDEIEKEGQEHKNLLCQAKEMYNDLGQEIQTLSHEKEVLISGKDKFEKEAQVQERTLQTLERELNQCQEKTQEATDKALKMCPRIDTTRDIEEIERQLAETSKVVESQNFGKKNRSEVLEKYNEKRNLIKEAEVELKRRAACIERINDMLKVRLKEFKDLSSFTRKIIQLSFATILAGNGYTGTINFDIKKSQLKLEVAPKAGQNVQTNHHTLSGGERSYVSLSFLLALWEQTSMPFRVLDEYDVFMDSNNRQLSVDLLVTKAKDMDHTQFIFLSPLDLPAMDWPRGCVKIHKMVPPKRKDKDQD